MRIIGYSSPDKALIVSPGPQSIDISGEVALTLGKRGCIGQWDGELHVPCDSEQRPSVSGVAAACRTPALRAGAICRKPEKTCLEEHSVYLAVFAPGRSRSASRRPGGWKSGWTSRARTPGSRSPGCRTARRRAGWRPACGRSTRTGCPSRTSWHPGPVDGAIEAVTKEYGVHPVAALRAFLRGTCG